MLMKEESDLVWSGTPPTPKTLNFNSTHIDAWKYRYTEI